MSQFEQLDHLLKTQDGMLRTEQAVSAGISKPVFYNYVRSRDLERVAHGMYLSKDTWVDAMYLLHLRFSQVVFSHDTALFFHDLTDREPLQYTVTVKTGYNPTKLKEEGVQIDRLMGHGGLFKTKEVGQKILAAAVNAPVTVMETAGEGGAWGIALLAGRLCAMQSCSGSRKFYGSIWRYSYDKNGKAAERFDPQPVQEKRCGRADSDAELHDGAVPGAYLPLGIS